MEQVLDLYQKPYDPDCPVVCMDAQPVQLVKETRPPMAATKKRPRRVDYEYERAGTASVFLFSEPLAGWRQATARARRTKVDWALDVAGPGLRGADELQCGRAGREDRRDCMGVRADGASRPTRSGGRRRSRRRVRGGRQRHDCRHRHGDRAIRVDARAHAGSRPRKIFEHHLGADLCRWCVARSARGWRQRAAGRGQRPRCRDRRRDVALLCRSRTG